MREQAYGLISWGMICSTIIILYAISRFGRGGMATRLKLDALLARIERLETARQELVQSYVDVNNWSADVAKRLDACEHKLRQLPIPGVEVYDCEECSPTSVVSEPRVTNSQGVPIVRERNSVSEEPERGPSGSPA